MGGATADSEYGTFDPLTVAVFPRILVGATFLASNGGFVTGGGGGEEGYWWRAFFVSHPPTSRLCGYPFGFFESCR
jgi:hypothetical protein